MVCFLLGLSGIDPMAYGLVVERFLNTFEAYRIDSIRSGRY